MRIYRRKESHPMKWVIASIIFILVMTVTWDEVEGITIPTNNSTSTTQRVNSTNDVNSNTPALTLDQIVMNNRNSGADNKTASVPTSIPEPGTLVLLAGGITAFQLMRRRSK